MGLADAFDISGGAPLKPVKQLGGLVLTTRADKDCDGIFGTSSYEVMLGWAERLVRATSRRTDRDEDSPSGASVSRWVTPN